MTLPPGMTLAAAAGSREDCAGAAGTQGIKVHINTLGKAARVGTEQRLV